jgi:uncharacterized membrane protein HdeD (DUF308 family)
MSQGYRASSSDVRPARGWLIGLGVVLAILGVLAVAASVATTLMSVLLLGGVLIVGGLVQIVHAFSAARWGGVVLSLLAGVLYTVVGALLLTRPVEGAVVITLLLAAFLLVAGLFRILAAGVLELPNSGWVLASGVISLLLGIGIWAQWPVSGLWVIGAYVGIEMIAYGVSLAMLGRALREPPAGYARREAA